MEAILASLLAPFLASLLAVGQRASAGAAEALGSEAGRLARRIWERLGSSVAEKPSAKEAAEDLAAQPDDEGARKALEWQLAKILKENAELRDELAGLVEEGQRSGVVADRGGVVIQGGLNPTHGGVAAGRDIKGNIRTGR